MSVSFSAVLLAGGKSSRMGRDKALIEIEGVPLWQRQVRLLENLEPHEIFISGSIQGRGCTTVPDASPNAGPLGGMEATLRRCATSLLVVLAVDLPKMTSTFIRGLLDESSGNCGVVPTMDDRFEPLAAIYPKTALALAEGCLPAREYTLQAFCRGCVSAGLVRPREITGAEKPLFQNLNTPADLISVSDVGRVSRRGGV